MTVRIKVADYTKEPVGRYRYDGHGNGEEFRQDYILPHIKSGKEIIIELDGINDEYGSSFLVEAFANLIRKEGISHNQFVKQVTFDSEHQDWIDEIDEYVEEAVQEIK